VHETSVAQSLAEFVEEQMSGDSDRPPRRVVKVSVRLGAMCGLLPHALKSAYRAAVSGTAINGCELEIETLSLVVWCPQCQEQRLLEDIRALRCPVCQTRTPQIIQGNEMEIASIEVVDGPATESSGS
jgi:hydrogenase nickel incorporation protein HypA/HybF